jgi:hypothetical protein
MYGLPDSAILGTAKRLKGARRSRRRSKQELGGLEVLQEVLHAGYVLYRRYKATHRKKK